MSNNLMDEPAFKAMLARVQNLQPQSKALWGGMSVSAMMNHCNKIHHAVATGAATDRSPRLKQRLMKMVALRFLPQLPKNVKTPAKTTLPDAPDMLHFEREKAQLISSLATLAANQAPLHQLHPLFGKLSNREWGRFIWMHTDHHLRQFGV